MIKYDVIIEQEFRDFIEEVNKKLRQGWQLQGGVSTTGSYYLQAIYKEITGYL